MIIGQANQPKTKSELVRRLGQLKNFEFKLYENVQRRDITGIKNEIEKSLSNKDTTILIIKNTR